MLLRTTFSIPLVSLILASPIAVNAGRLMQGPMVGNIDSNSATIWARVAGESELSIRYSAHSNFSDAKVTEPVQSLSENDYCVSSKIEGLEANQKIVTSIDRDGLADGVVVKEEKK